MGGMKDPFIAVWDGDAFAPLKRFHNVCAASLVIGQRYQIEIIHERSAKSHAAYFAELHDIWLSLPDELAAQFPTEDIMRKHALILGGFATSKQYVGASRAEALRVAALMRQDDEYSIVTTKGAIVTQLKAKSQNYKSMDAREFQASKESVLDFCRALVGAEREKAA